MQCQHSRYDNRERRERHGRLSLLTAGAGAFNINATISATVGRSVSISGRGAGVVTFSRAISDTGITGTTGIFLDNNDVGGIGTITSQVAES